MVQKEPRRDVLSQHLCRSSFVRPDRLNHPQSVGTTGVSQYCADEEARSSNRAGSDDQGAAAAVAMLPSQACRDRCVHPRVSAFNII